jgi:hypothetical protein
MSTTASRRNDDDPQPLRPSENSHHALSSLKHRIPSSTFKKQCDDDDAAAQTDTRVSPGMRRGVGKRCIRRPSRRNDGAHRRHRIDAGRPTGISPYPQKTTTPTLHRAPPNSPPTNSRHHDYAITTAVSSKPK